MAEPKYPGLSQRIHEQGLIAGQHEPPIMVGISAEEALWVALRLDTADLGEDLLRAHDTLVATDPEMSIDMRLATVTMKHAADRLREALDG